MKIVVYGPLRRVGVLDDRRVVDAHGAYATYAREVLGEAMPYVLAAAMAPSDLGEFINAGSRAIQSLHEALDYLANAGHDKLGPNGEALIVPADETKLHPPLASRASRIMNLGGNFADHMQDYRLHRLGEQVTIEQVQADVRAQGLWGFYKIAASAIGTDEDLVYPDHTGQLDYEGEVAIVFGRPAKSRRPEDLDAHVWGFTLENDWSLRDQVENPLSGYAIAKNFDGSVSLGPCIVVNEIGNPQDVAFETHVNGELRQRGNTRDMIFSFGEAFEYLTRCFTIQPGDILSAGTNAGTAVDMPAPDGAREVDLSLFAKPGDTVEISSPSIGTLRNRVVPSAEAR
jgi:2-keto-4-pentenoate hydratase/2-oxohepta-3-ene-1,7-dioic acid hydratase in catechol pathway